MNRIWQIFRHCYIYTEKMSERYRKPLQILSEEYIDRCIKLTLMERLQILEEYRLLLPMSVWEEYRREKSGYWLAKDS